MKPGDYTPFDDESDEDYAERVRQGWEKEKEHERARRDGPLPKKLERVKIATLDRALPPPLLLDRLDPRESTTLYGPGGTGKGSIACHWITGLVRTGNRVLILDYENHESEWARRLWSLHDGGIAAGEQVMWAAPLTQKLGPIWNHADAIKDAVAEDEIDYIVIDSAVFACAGADPSKAEVAIQYGEALQIIGTPSLTLAHVTKVHDPKYPFGSAFWHNATRVSWSVMPQDEPGKVLLACRKANNYRKPSPQMVTIDWINDELRDVREVPSILDMEDQIAELLAGGVRMTSGEIVAAINDGLETTHPRGTIVSALSKGTGKRFTVDKDKHYSLRQEVD